MIHHDRHGTGYGHEGRRPAYNSTPVPEETLASEKIQIERKVFLLTLKENPRGRFLRITEDVGGRRDHIIVPATGLEEFKRVLDGLIALSNETPAKIA